MRVEDSRDYAYKKTPKTRKFVGFEVLTAAVMKSAIFWYITPYSPLKVR
jgi:hypothetical protein